MSIVKIDASKVGLWSEMWIQIQEEDNSRFFRDVSKEYFISKYLNKSETKGFYYYYDENIVAFWGERYIKKDGVLNMEICDFVIDSKFRANGYLKKITSEIIEKVKRDVNSINFYPINRQAMVSWKFTLNPTIVQRFSKWILDLDKLELKKDSVNNIKFMEIDTSEKNKVFTSEFYRWRYVDYYQNQYYYNISIKGIDIGFFVYREIYFNDNAGVEIEKFELLDFSNIKFIFDFMLNFLKIKKYKFVILKISQESDLETYINKELNLKKLKENKYKFIVEIEQGCSKKIDEDYQVCNEDLDIPRDSDIITKLYKDERIDNNE